MQMKERRAIALIGSAKTRLRQAYVAATLSGMPNLKTRARRSLRRWPQRAETFRTSLAACRAGFEPCARIHLCCIILIAGLFPYHTGRVRFGIKRIILPSLPAAADNPPPITDY